MQTGFLSKCWNKNRVLGFCTIFDLSKLVIASRTKLLTNPLHSTLDLDFQLRAIHFHFEMRTAVASTPCLSFTQAKQHEMKMVQPLSTGQSFSTEFTLRNSCFWQGSSHFENSNFFSLHFLHLSPCPLLPDWFVPRSGQGLNWPQSPYACQLFIDLCSGQPLQGKKFLFTPFCRLVTELEIRW